MAWARRPQPQDPDAHLRCSSKAEMCCRRQPALYLVNLRLGNRLLPNPCLLPHLLLAPRLQHLLVRSFSRHYCKSVGTCIRLQIFRKRGVLQDQTRRSVLTFCKIATWCKCELIGNAMARFGSAPNILAERAADCCRTSRVAWAFVRP